MTSRYILDACALIAYLNDEEGAEIVEKIIQQTWNGQASTWMSVINPLEVYYGVRRELGADRANEILKECRALPIEIINSISDDVFEEVGRIKASYRVSLADSIALGLASIMGASLLTSDHHEFDVIEDKESVNFAWIR